MKNENKISEESFSISYLKPTEGFANESNPHASGKHRRNSKERVLHQLAEPGNAVARCAAIGKASAKEHRRSSDKNTSEIGTVGGGSRLKHAKVADQARRKIA